MHQKTPLELAALATAAVPGLQVTGLRPPQYCDEVLSVTGIIDASGNTWTVTCPHDAVGGLDLDMESGVLSRLAKAKDARRIPFDVPRVHGRALTPSGERVIVHQDLGGRVMTEADFTESHILPVSFAKALAALHNLPESVYTSVNLPAYTAAESRERLHSLLDEAAAQVLIPANLWNRWEGALEDISLWRFAPAPIHGDLQGNSVIINDGVVLALTGFSSAHVGDPAQDIAWVLAQASDDFLDRFRETYCQQRTVTDLQLFTRAQLLSELAIVRWLVHGLHAQDRSIIADARQMLSELSHDLGEDDLVARRDPIVAPPTAQAPSAKEAGSASGSGNTGEDSRTDADEAEGQTRPENRDEEPTRPGGIEARPDLRRTASSVDDTPTVRLDLENP